MDRYRTLLEVNNAVIHCLGQSEFREVVTAALERVMPREGCNAEELELLAEVSSQGALAAANSRAFEEIHSLKSELRVQSIAPAAEGSLLELERRHISATLERCRWVIEGNRGAAKALGLHPNTLRHRLRKLDLKRPSKEPKFESNVPLHVVLIKPPSIT